METMSTSEAVAWIIAAAKENARLYHDTLHSIVGVYNAGMRGALICTAAEQAGLLHGYKDSLQFLMKAGLVPDDLKDEAEEVMKLSLLQDQQPVAEAQAEEVDMDVLRAEIRAEVKAEMDSLHQADAKMAELNQKERDEAVKAAKDAREKLAEARQAAEDAEKAHAEELEKVKRQAWEDARTAEDNYKAKLAEVESKAQEETTAARRQAEETARRMDMAADESAVRFGLLFDQLQDAAGKVLDLADTVQAAGDAEKAGKFRAALRRALLALADEAEGVQE